MALYSPRCLRATFRIIEYFFSDIQDAKVASDSGDKNKVGNEEWDGEKTGMCKCSFKSF